MELMRLLDEEFTDHNFKGMLGLRDHLRLAGHAVNAKRVGMPQSLLSQYVSGIKKPGEKQVRRILDGIRQVGRELAEMDFA